MALLMDLETLLTLIRDAWPHRFERGRVFHIHRNAAPVYTADCEAYDS
jgi:hypothetical protein